jgi:hypothetical protein
MNSSVDLLARFSDEGGGQPLCLPDLTMWHEWHQGRGTLPKWAVVWQAIEEARSDRRMILGVADRVPVDAETERVEAARSLVEQAS